MHSRSCFYVLFLWLCLCGLFANSAAALAVNDRVRCTTDALKIRTAPPTLTDTGGRHNTGDQGRIISGPLVGTAGGYNGNWWQVDFDAGSDGWAAEIYLEKVTVVQPPPAPVALSPGTPGTPGQVILPTTPQLTWSKSAGATTYEVQVSKEPYGAANLVYNNLNTGDVAAVAVNPLPQNVNYRWNMYAKNAAGSSALSNTLYFSVQGPELNPVLNSVTPANSTGSNSPRTFTLNGSNFVNGATVILTVGGQDYNISAGNTAFMSSVRIDVTANTGTDPDTWSARVRNPAGQTSGTVNFTVTAPSPIITSLAPASASAGGSAFTLTVNGSTFHQGSIVRWNGTDLSTTPVLSGGGLVTALTASVSAARIAAAGSATVTVYSPGPGGGTSAGATFTIGSTPSGDYLYGIDVSHHQGTLSASAWSSVASAGKKFAIIKATQGATILDGEFAHNNSAAMAAGVVTGAYHFPCPDLNTATAEATFFVQSAGAAIGQGHLPPALDLEAYANCFTLPTGGGPNAAFTAWVRTWCQTVYNATGIRPMIYTRTNISVYLESDMAVYPLWLTKWDSSPSLTPSSMTPWPAWTFKQYQSGDPNPGATGYNGTCPGIGPCDLDSFNGSQTAFNALINQTGNPAQVTINSAGPAPASVSAGATFQINASVTSTSVRNILQGTSIAPAGTQNFISDAAHDAAASLVAGTKNLSRSFTVPAGTAQGSYDLYYALWSDTDSNGVINAGDQQLAFLMVPAAVQVTATIRYTLTVSSSPPGSGSVSRNPSQADYAAGTQVSVTASPAAGWRFTGWVGDAGGNNNPVSVGLDRNKTVQAIFEGIPQLAVSPTDDIPLPGAAGTSASTGPLSIVNMGQGEMAWTASSAASWLHLDATGGTVADGGGVLNELSYSWDANPNSGTRAATVTITATGVAGSPKTFTFTQSAGNAPPVISNLAHQAVNEDTATALLAFTVSDSGTAAAALTVSATSSDTSLVPQANVVPGGAGGNRTVKVTPASNQSGAATITVTVSDGVLTASDAFILTVNAVNDAPTITDVADLTLAAGTPSSAIPFTVGDIETAAASLNVSGSSSNTALVPIAGIVVAGAGAGRTVTITPAAGQSGAATVTLTVSDGSLTATDTFVVTVTAPAGLATWRQNRFGANAGNESIAGPLANPDKDQLVNLLEYALGGDPNSASSAPAPVNSVVSNRMTLTFTRTPANNDITLTVQGADSIQGPWTDLARSTADGAMTVVAPGTGVTETGAGATRSVQVRDVFTVGQASHPRRFLRLAVNH